MTRSTKLERVCDLISGHMHEIQRMFKPGSKITVIVRHDDEPEADVALTNDSWAEVREAVDRAVTLEGEL